MEKGFLMKEHADPYFYIILKVHKDLVHSPGHPIIAGIYGLSSGPEDYVDSFLQSLVKQLPAYVKDTGHILEILEKCRWKNDYLWLSLDVSSLYTYIPHEAGLQALRYFLEGESELPASQIKFIIKKAVFIL